MCGINGFTWHDPQLARAMNRATRHRGPDGSGVYSDSWVTLGHTRLAIIDLSPAGRQPMANEDGSLWIVYNGEVYNFRDVARTARAAGHIFRSSTDTEAILHAYEMYGLDTFAHLNGMWGLAIYERRSQRLVLCRDRFGVKPLYYAEREGGLIFSSMISAILVHGGFVVPSARAVMEYLAFGLEQHGAYTFVEGISSLLPGHFLIYDLRARRSEIGRWYNPTLYRVTRPCDLSAAFMDSVRIRLVADVPVGVSLSGGVDSTAIACAIRKVGGPDFCTYSMVAPGSRVDETPYIVEACRSTGARPFFTTVTPQQFVEDLEDFTWSMEEPVGGLSAYGQYCVFRLAHENGAKVLLDGQGGDELFGGYVYYFAYWFHELAAARRWLGLSREMISVFGKMRTLFPHGLFLFIELPSAVRNWTWRHFIGDWVDYSALCDACGDAGAGDPRWRRMSVRECLDETLWATSIPHNLMWEDKSSMRWSVESRVPFMDYRLVERALSLGAPALLGDGETKRIFREAIGGILPRAIRDRKDKIGFELEESQLLRHPSVAPVIWDIVDSRSFRTRPYWHYARVRRLARAHLAGKRSNPRALWRCVNLELWLQGLRAAGRKVASAQAERASLGAGLGGHGQGGRPVIEYMEAGGLRDDL